VAFESQAIALQEKKAEGQARWEKSSTRGGLYVKILEKQKIEIFKKKNQYGYFNCRK